MIETIEAMVEVILTFKINRFGLLSDVTQTCQAVNSLRQQRQPIASALL